MTESERIVTRTEGEFKVTNESEAYMSKRDLPNIPPRLQTQRALNDQLCDLIAISARLGLYDASDFLKRFVWVNINDR